MKSPQLQECLCERFGKLELSPGGRRSENSCLFVVFTNLEALLQTLWITAGLKHFRHSPRVIKKQVVSDEFWICDARKGTTENNYIKELVMLLYLFQLSKSVAVDFCGVFFVQCLNWFNLFIFFKLKMTACLFTHQLICVSELIRLSSSGKSCNQGVCMWRRSGMNSQVKQAPDLISRNCRLCLVWNQKWTVSYCTWGRHVCNGSHRSSDFNPNHNVSLSLTK